MIKFLLISSVAAVLYGNDVFAVINRSNTKSSERKLKISNKDQVKELFQKINKKDWKGVINAIEDDADVVNYVDRPSGDYPLHSVVSYKNLEITKFLIEHQADINAKNKSGKTPLHIAIEKKALEIIEYLVDNGADISAKDNQGVSPLQLAKNKVQTIVFENQMKWDYQDIVEYLEKTEDQRQKIENDPQQKTIEDQVVDAKSQQQKKSRKRKRRAQTNKRMRV